jgi:isopenicillin-N N-acyltransferase-like protein
LIFGVGDGRAEEFNGVQYSSSVANFYTDTDMMPEADWHPRMDNVVYYGMDWLCPGYSTPLHAQLTKYHGNITAENTIRDITAIVQTGENQRHYQKKKERKKKEEKKKKKRVSSPI